MFAKTRTELEHIREESTQFLSDKALKYLNSLPDNEQDPTARVDVGRDKDIYMYRRSAFSSVESMNQAN